MIEMEKTFNILKQRYYSQKEIAKKVRILILSHIQKNSTLHNFLYPFEIVIIFTILYWLCKNEDRLAAELKESRDNYDKLVAYTTEKLALAQKEVENSQTEFSNKEGMDP